MSNSMDNKEIKVSNSIDDFVFLFKAKFNNGDALFQEDGATFKEVKDRFNELKEFSLYSKDLQQTYIVNLSQGYISSDRLNYQSDEIKSNVRLIYFRHVEIKTDFKTQTKQITYNLGYQYLDNAGNNHKVIVQIFENGEFIICG